MGNQFNARLYWHRREIWTHDEATGATATIRCEGGKEYPYLWTLRAPDVEPDGGRTKTEQAARDAVRRRIVKLPAKAGGQ